MRCEAGGGAEVRQNRSDGLVGMGAPSVLSCRVSEIALGQGREKGAGEERRAEEQRGRRRVGSRCRLELAGSVCRLFLFFLSRWPTRNSSAEGGMTSGNCAVGQPKHWDER